MKRTFAKFAVMAFTVAAVTTAPMATAGAATSAPTSTAGCYNWAAPSSIGEANGTVCDGYVSGYVKDTRADGKCPFVRFEFNNGGVEDSPWVGPKGAQKNFGLGNRSGPTKWYMMHVSC